MAKWTELLTIWNSKLPVLDKERAFWFRTLRWFFAAFLCFSVIQNVGMYYLIEVIKP